MHPATEPERRKQYIEDVISDLEYFGFEDYAVLFPTEELSLCMAETIKTCYRFQQSHRRCALFIFGFAMWVYSEAKRDSLVH